MNKSCLDLSEFHTDQYIDIKERLVALEKHLSDPFSDCYVERLLDVVVACVTECTKTVKNVKNENMLAFLQRFLNVAVCLQSYRRKPEDFSFISSLGHGAFGRVQLVREITTGRVCAMKVLKKSRMLAQHTDYWAEKEIMSHGESPWIVQLYYAYQDLKNLYMVMEYVPGGNLVSWMDEVEFMSEAACRFYAAETILALIDLHAMGFIHRDLKPDNLLLDAGGHLKLADFGTAIRVDPETSLIHCDAAVGTPDYLSPEVLLSQGIGGGSYGFEVDWWALGVVIYEMLYGVTPFYSETLVNTYANIMNHANSLKFPENVNVSDACLDFMKKLLCDRTQRLGSQAHCLSEVYNHPWFSIDWIQSQQTDGHLDSMDVSIADWTWSNIRASRAPFQPHLRSETDTSYFQPETDDEDDELMVDGENVVDKDSSNHGRNNGHDSELVDVTNNNNNGKCKDVARGGDFPESSNSDHKYSGRCSDSLLELPGSQLVFAGFSFSSSHPHHLALLNGLHSSPLRGSNLTASASSSDLLKNGDNINNNSNKLGSVQLDKSMNHQLQENKCDNCKNSFLKSNGDVSSINNLLINNENENVMDSNISNHTKCESQLAGLRIQLDDALTLSDTHLNEISSLTVQLEQANARCHELENKLSLQEINFKKIHEEMERQLENVHAEAAKNRSYLEAEIIKWKTLAQSEEAARQSAETAGSIAVATATAQLARRAVEVVDRLGRSGARNNLSRVAVSPNAVVTSDPSNLINSNSNLDLNNLSDHSDIDMPEINQSLDNPSTATELLINRMEEVAKRAHRAEIATQEAVDQLEAEKHFSRLYKETCAEKTDQLNEKVRELELLHDNYAKSCKANQRACEKYEAALRALNEEQQKSARYLEAAQNAKESAHAATQRAACASSEVAQLRVELERMTQAYRKEQTKCTATVNKLTEVMSGKNPDTLELMWLASFQQQEQEAGGRTVSPFSLGSNSARGKVANLKGLGQQKRMTLQLNQRHKENKRLISEINRLNDELSTLRKEYESKLHSNELHTMSMELELASLREQLHTISITNSLSQQCIDNNESIRLLRHHNHQNPSSQQQLNQYCHRNNISFNKSLLTSDIPSSVANNDNSNNNNIITNIHNDNIDCDFTLNKSFGVTRPTSTIPPTPHSSVSQESVVKYPIINNCGTTANNNNSSHLKPSPLNNTCSSNNSRNSTEMLSSYTSPTIDDPLVSDFKFYGILEVGPKRGKRNKLHWEPCFAQLSRTHLMLWDIPSDLCKRVHELQSKYLVVSNFVASTISSNINNLTIRLEMPLNSLYHVRSVNSCDVCHERVEDLPRVFQIIYDRQYLSTSTSITNKNNASNNNSIYTGGMKQSSSGNAVSNVGKMSNTSHSGDFASHPRKSSFGSSALFSTSSPHPSSSRRVVRNDSVSSSHPHSVSNASNKRLNQTENSTIEHQINSPSSESPHNVESSTIYTKGHVLQRILFRSYATCDLCQNSCSGVFHPPVSYQCTDCQIKLHACHLENNDYPLPQCAKAVGVCLLRASTVQDKEQWMEYLLLTMKTMKSLSSTPNITTRKSFNQELSNVSIPSTTLPSSPTGRCIPVHGCGPLQSLSPSVPSSPSTNLAIPIRFINLTPSSDHQISHARSKSSICVRDSLKSRPIENSSVNNSTNDCSLLSHQSYIPTLVSYSLRPTCTINNDNNNPSNGNISSTTTSIESSTPSATSQLPGVNSYHEQQQMSRSFTLGLTKYRSEDYTDCSVNGNSSSNHHYSGVVVRSISKRESPNFHTINNSNHHHSNSYTGSNNNNNNISKASYDLSPPILSSLHHHPQKQTSSIGSIDSTSGGGGGDTSSS
ncbi:CDC42 binding protein kinase [Schistosoma haematobium]|uniref:non-specific serine/threonine protein kinase n=2 Tax=Schistosoma haematobium TaxID=6185 RepID=A0A922S431_SCHHA|nr:CDC42 binding protein kinase [Schistosoma haematobium]KAH9592491.1 CDC42 binding protein kinase [Schistosoma haematobium]